MAQKKQTNEELAVEIDNEGLCYWVMNYAHEGTIEDHKVSKLVSEIQPLLEELDSIFIEYM